MMASTRARLATGLLIAVFWVLWGLEQEAALAAHRPMWSQDLAFFNQILFHASQGEAWTSPILLEPTGFFNMVHFHPVIAGILPIYWLRPEASTLLWINAGAVALTAWPLYRLGKEAAKSEAFGVAAATAWLVWLPSRSAAIADFRPMVFWIPALAWLVWGLYSQRRRAWIAGLVLLCAAREESAYLLLSIGVLLAVGLPIGGKRRREGLWILGAGVLWLVFLLLFKANLFFHFNPMSLLSGEGGEGPSGDLQSARLSFWGQCLGGGYLGALLQPAALALGAGPAHWLMTDSAREWHALHGVEVYLKNPMLVLIACSGTLGAAWVVRKKQQALWPVCGLLILGNALSFGGDRSRLNQRRTDNHAFAASQEASTLRALLAQVGPEDRVATDYRLIAALSGRPVIWNAQAHLHLEDDSKPHHWKAPWPIQFDAVDSVLMESNDPQLDHLGQDWSQAATGAGYSLWRRESPPPQVDPAEPTH